MPTALATRARAPVPFEEFVHFTARQMEAERASQGHRHTLFGGSAGGGKSYYLRWSLIHALLYYAATYKLTGVRVGLFCEDYPSLHDRQISKIEAELPVWLGRYHSTAKELRLHARYGAGVLCYRSLNEPSQFRSAEFAQMAFDESTTCLPSQDTYDFLITRLRWPGIPDTDWRMKSATNPGGPGHLWIKRRWIDRQFEGLERPEEYAFVPARVSDNPYLPPGYADSLAALPEELRRAYLDGDWNVFLGQIFGEWRHDIHVLAPFEIPLSWPRYRSIDYGYAAPSAVYWIAEGPGRHYYVYRELYQAGLGPLELAQTIRAMSPAEEGVAYTVADPSLFAHNEQTGISNAMVLQANGVPCVPGDNHRVPGWRQLHDYLEVYEEPVGGEMAPTAHLQVFSGCANLIRTLPALPYSKTRTEDADTDAEDHSCDSIRYLVQSRPPVDTWRKPMAPEPEPPGDSRKVKDIQEVHRMMMGRRVKR